MDFLREYWQVGLGVAVTLLVWWRISQKPTTLDLKRLKRQPSPLPYTKPPTLLVEVLPEFAVELENLLSEEGKPELASQVQQLRILDRCRCQDDFCSTFYVCPKPEGSYGPDHDTVVLSPKEGMVNVDVTDGKVACIEVLYRKDVQARLHAFLP